MTTGWDLLPETAKALSKPVTKLIEVIAAGCGKVYGPTDIRRTAQAQADAMLVLQTASSRSELSKRAAERLLAVEERRQTNIETIAHIAINQLPDEVSSAPVDADWSLKFIRESQDVSNETMQLIWGKLLAREITSPSSFTQRTLAIVSNMTCSEAVSFEALCPLASNIHEIGLFTFVESVNYHELRDRGITYLNLRDLQAAGLITLRKDNEELSVVVRNSGETVKIERPSGRAILLTSRVAEVANEMPLGIIEFTPAGRELFKIANWQDNAREHDNFITKRMSRCGWITSIEDLTTPNGLVSGHSARV